MWQPALGKILRVDLCKQEAFSEDHKPRLKVNKSESVDNKCHFHSVDLLHMKALFCDEFAMQTTPFSFPMKQHMKFLFSEWLCFGAAHDTSFASLL